MLTDILYSMNEWLLFGIISVLFFLASEVGFQIGRIRRADVDESGKSQINTLQAAILGLLALLLGFTFSMVLSRFDARKQMVLEESNAIGTCYLRAQMLPEPQKTEISKLLRQYVDVRLEVVRTGNLQEIVSRSEKLHDQLWSQAVATEKKEPQRLITLLFIQSLNDVIDIHSGRLRAVLDQVPDMVWVLLFVLTIFAMGMIGFGSGLGKGHQLIPRLVVAVLIALVVLVIMDLGQPQRGLIRVSQQSMMMLRDSINRPAP